jgi:type II secretory pathway component PulC
MGRPLRLLNLALGLVAVLIVGTLAKAWVSPASFITSPSVAKPTQEPTEVAFSRPARPPLAQFDVLLEKNPFKQAPPQPVISHRTNPPRPPPPLPLPTLMGTILVDDQRRAILSDKGKANIYSIGQEVAGGTLTAISEDRVLFKRGDEVSELTLKAPIQPGASPPPPASAPPPQAAPGSVPPPPPPGAIEGAPSRAALSGAEHRRLRLLQQQGLVKPSQQTAE